MLKIKLIFSNGITHELTGSLDGSDTSKIISLDVNESITKNTGAVYGGVSVSRIRLTLSNMDGIYTPSNSSSPVYGKMDTSAKVEVYSDDKLYGVYYISEWGSGLTYTGYTKVNIVACDKLGSILHKTIPHIGIDERCTFKSLISKLLGSCDFTAVVPALDDTIILEYSSLKGKTIGEALDTICQGMGGYIWEDGNGTVYAYDISHFSELIPKMILSGSKNVVSCEANGEIYRANTLGVNYVDAKKSETLKLFEVESLSLPQGDSSKIIEVGEGIFSINGVHIINEKEKDKMCFCTGLSYSQAAASVDFHNPHTAPQNVRFSLYGTRIEYIQNLTQIQTGTDGGELIINNPLIQSQAQAEAYKASLNTYIKKKRYTLRAKVPHTLRCGNCISVDLIKMGIKGDGIILAIDRSMRVGDFAQIQVLI